MWSISFLSLYCLYMTMAFVRSHNMCFTCCCDKAFLHVGTMLSLHYVLCTTILLLCRIEQMLEEVEAFVSIAQGRKKEKGGRLLYSTPKQLSRSRMSRSNVVPHFNSNHGNTTLFQTFKEQTLKTILAKVHVSKQSLRKQRRQRPELMLMLTRIVAIKQVPNSKLHSWFFNMILRGLKVKIPLSNYFISFEVLSMSLEALIARNVVNMEQFQNSIFQST